MTQTVTLSVIIPCYNQAALLHRALASVAAQNVAGVETIVVDDGSTEDVRSVALGFTPQPRYVRQSNQGLAAARNRGLGAARGSLLIFLDADDRLLDGGIAAGLACLRRHPDAAFVFGGYSNVSIDGREVRPPVKPVPRSVGFADFLRRNVIGMHGAVLYRREALLKAGGFDPGLRFCEDYDLYLRLTRTATGYGHCALVAEYRRQSGSLSSRSGQMLDACLVLLQRQRPHCTTVELRRAYRAGLRFALAKYGYQAVRQMAARLIRGDWSNAFRELLSVMGRMPRWLSAC